MGKVVLLAQLLCVLLKGIFAHPSADKVILFAVTVEMESHDITPFYTDIEPYN